MKPNGLVLSVSCEGPERAIVSYVVSSDNRAWYRSGAAAPPVNAVRKRIPPLFARATMFIMQTAERVLATLRAQGGVEASGPAFPFAVRFAGARRDQNGQRH